MSNNIIRCSRCKRRCRNMAGWNATMAEGVAVGVLCPTCQTPEEIAETEIYNSTLVYGRDAVGRVTGRPKIGIGDE